MPYKNPIKARENARKRGKTWYWRHVIQIRTIKRRYMVAWRKKYPGRYLSGRYGISWGEVLVIKKSPCGICGTKKGIQIDHNHKTLVVRGPLCRKHNSLVGLLEACSKKEIQKAFIWIGMKN